MEIELYLDQLKDKLLHKSNWKQLTLTREWTAGIPNLAGVYALKQTDSDNLVYVGETGSLRGRMKDLLDSGHHTVRRTIGERFYFEIEGFVKATSKVKFPDHIEILVNDHICTKLSIAYIEVKLGRKELEEFIQDSINIDMRLNKRGKRKTN